MNLFHHTVGQSVEQLRILGRRCEMVVAGSKSAPVKTDVTLCVHTTMIWESQTIPGRSTPTVSAHISFANLVVSHPSPRQMP